MKATRSLLVPSLLVGAVIGIGVTMSAPAGTVVGGLPDFSSLSQALAPSVVNISTESEEPEADQQRRQMQDPFEGFGGGGPRRSLGSGFVFDQEGYNNTNTHNDKKATKNNVRLH